MQCPNCENDQQNVLVKPERFTDHDLRTAQCAQCGMQFELITRIKSVYVFNPVTEERESVSLDRFARDDFKAILRGDKPHPAKVSFDREHGHA